MARSKKTADEQTADAADIQIIEFNSSTALKVFTPFEQQIAELKKQNAIVFDYADPAGAKAARSQIASVRKVKGTLERTRKEAKAASLAFQKELDGTAKAIESQLQEMIDLHEGPLKEIEAKEEARKQAIHARILTLRDYQGLPLDATAQQLQAALDAVNAFAIDASLQEFAAHAIAERDEAEKEISALLARRKQFDADQAELQRLRDEAAEIARKEREKQIAEAAAQQARDKAENDARERDQQQARQLAQEKAQREAAEDRARRAEQEAAAAVESERRRQEQKEADERAEAEKRERNKRHRAAIHNAILAAMNEAAPDLTEAQAKAIIVAIASGKVPAVSITY